MIVIDKQMACGEPFYEFMSLAKWSENRRSKKIFRQDSNVYSLLELKWNSAEGKIVPFMSCLNLA